MVAQFSTGILAHFSISIYRNRPFAVIFLPNPGTGRVFIKYLNSNGVQCTALKELWDTEEIAGFIRQNLS